MVNPDGRCACGCRIFYDRRVRITVSSGAAFEIPSAVIVECVRCGGISRIIGDDGERKTVVPFVSGKDAERELFLMAMRDWENKDHPDKNPNFIVIEDSDKKDFEILGVKNT